jgi:hypothetical protein
MVYIHAGSYMESPRCSKECLNLHIKTERKTKGFFQRAKFDDGTLTYRAKHALERAMGVHVDWFECRLLKPPVTQNANENLTILDEQDSLEDQELEENRPN